jgi:hypothetical protein
MRKLIFITIVCAFLTAPALADMRINLQTSFTGRLGTTNGGEFLVTVLNATNGGGDAIGIYEVGSSFKTFCVETDEYVSGGSSNYYVTIDTEAWQGGTGGPEPDPLSPQSAYLYSSWLDNTITNTNDNANAVQRAIWWFEQENNGQNNLLVAQANTAVGVGGSWYNKWGANSIGDIRVMNLWTNANHTGNAQDQLVLVPAPVPGAVLLGMLGLGVAGLKLRKLV